MVSFIVGACILLDGVGYKVLDVQKDTYLLQATFEEAHPDYNRTYTEYFKAPYVNKYGKEDKSVRGKVCIN